MQIPRRGWLARVIIFTAVTAAYYGAACLGMRLGSLNGYMAPIWPAFGLMLGAATHFGGWLWPAAFLGSLLAQPARVPLGVWAFAAAGSALEAIVGYAVMLRIMNQDRFKEFYGPQLGLLAGAAAGAAMSATIGVTALTISGFIPAARSGTVWMTWAVVDLIGALAVAPLLINLEPASDRSWLRRGQLPELAALVVVTAGTLGVVFGRPCSLPPAFLLLPLLFWALARFNGLADLFVLLATMAAVTATCLHRGPFQGGSQSDNYINMHLFILTLCLTGLFLKGMRGKISWRLPSAVLLCGWTFSAAVAYFVDEHKQRLDAANFHSLVADAEADLRQRVGDVVDNFERDVRFLTTGRGVTQDDWHSYASALGQTTRYPGLLGVGFLAASGEGAFFEPAGVLPPDFGLTGSPQRQVLAAAEKARDTGLPTLAHESLAPGAQGKQVFLLFLPLYDRLAVLTSPEQRRSVHRGWVFAAIDLEDFFHLLTASMNKQLGLVVRDQGSAVLYADPAAAARVETSAHIELASYPLDLEWHRGPAFVSFRDFGASGLASVTSLLSLTLALIVVNLQSVGRRASSLARRMTGELAEREQVWMTLTESAPVGIFQTDADGRCLYVNQRCIDLTGVPLVAVRGESWLATVHRDDQVEVRRAWLELQNGKPFHQQYRTLKPGDPDTWVTGFAAPTRDASGRVTGYVGTVQDISQIKKQQRELIASSKMSSLGEMAGGIAHEVNNPLMIIQAMADQLRRMCDRGELDAPKARSTAQQIDETVRRIAKIITGLRAFARNADRDPLAPATIGAIVDATLGLCQQRFRAKGVEVRVSGDLAAELDCRAVQLSQVLLNLLNNAFDAIERLDSKWITIEAREESDAVNLCVSDSGPRIAEEIAAKMFQPFFTTKPVGRGTGLGLSISKGIVEDHGGTIALCDQGPNTCFAIRLPKSGERAE